MSAELRTALPGEGRYRKYVLGILTLVFTLNFVDRALVILLLQSIKDDLHLSDTQLGFLSGIAFAVFYTVIGLPVARWADRGNRVAITSIAIGLWGLTVMACVLITNFSQLLAARICAAVGESGCMPPTYSLLGDYFPLAGERTRAMGTYWLANPLSGLIGFVAGGWLNQALGWRMTFFVLGVPALLVAALVKLSVREPRQSTGPATVTSPSVSGMTDVMRCMWRHKSARHLCVAIVLFFTIGQGLGQWFGAFMIRTHGMSTAELGLWLGLSFGIGGAIGVLGGGYIAGRWFGSNERAQMRLTAVMVALLFPCSAAFLLIPEKRWALIALVPWALVLNFFFGPAFALLQRLVADEMRATSVAVVMLLANLIGMGIGPQIVGVLSDGLRPMFGSDALRYAMLSVSLVALWSAYHFWKVGETVREDIRERVPA
jgi:predicted MFS family arabinose efflux permease